MNVYRPVPREPKPLDTDVRLSTVVELVSKVPADKLECGKITSVFRVPRILQNHKL